MSENSLKFLKIIKSIQKELMTSELSGNIGLHAGTSGIALFLAYYDRIVQKKDYLSQRVYNILAHNIELIDSGCRQHTICSGISGFGWLCEHLTKTGMLNREDVEFLDHFDDFLFIKMMTDIKQGNYDYLHGAIGVGTYMLSRFDKQEIPMYIEMLLSELEKSGIPCDNNSIKWESVLNKDTGEKGFNISLSHGMSSIAAFLIRLHQLNFETERVECLLTKTINYILSQSTYIEGNISYFPSYAKESSNGNNNSRLSWCYGDMGIALVTLRAARILKNEEWRKTSLRILLHNSLRRDLKQNRIMDACLCHGSAGIAHIFENIYLNTFVKEFRETSDYWLDITMKMARHSDGFAGFKSWYTEEYGGYKNADSLLEGIAGIGLVFLSHLEGNKMTWDECFLLS